MDLDQLAGQTLVAGYPAGPAPKALRAALAADALAGAILFKRNVGTPAETAAALATLREGAPGPTPLLCVDQEGGRVARLGPPVRVCPVRRANGALEGGHVLHRECYKQTRNVNNRCPECRVEMKEKGEKLHIEAPRQSTAEGLPLRRAA